MDVDVVWVHSGKGGFSFKNPQSTVNFFNFLRLLLEKDPRISLKGIKKVNLNFRSVIF